MITRVQVKNFRSMADIDVELGRLTVLVGRNGAGKSAFLDVLRFVRDSFSLGLESAIADRQGIASIRRWAPRKRHDLEVDLTARYRRRSGQYSIAISSQKSGAYNVVRERCDVWNVLTRKRYEFETGDGKWIVPPHCHDLLSGERQKAERSLPDEGVLPADALVLPALAPFWPEFSGFIKALLGHFYYISPKTLRQPQKPSQVRLLTDGGENLASVLRELQRKDSGFADVIAAMKRVVDGIEDVRVQQVGGYLVTELKHNDIGHESRAQPWFELARESDGTLRILGILVALYQAGRQGLTIAFEEPENALHPGALPVLADVLREASRRNQILVTTQSPDLISNFGVHELRVVERVNGLTQINRIQRSQRQAIEERLFSAGDLVRVEGLHVEPPPPHERPGA
ncbi:MAG TPA: AAA family ATPase [Blastocatellia bacterium]